jgi:hypothetical protein
VNADEKKVFVTLWNERLDEIEPLSISLWLQEYAKLDDIKDSDSAKSLMLRIDKKLRTAADTIDQLTKERDEARRERDETRREFCEVCAPEWGLPSPQWLAKDKGWDCYKETQ